MIDLHCHLDLYPDPASVIRRCIEKKMYVLSVTTVPSAFEGTLAISAGSERIRTALGLHPELAVAREHELPLFEKLLPGTRYVGEIGLDGSRDHRATLDRQSGILADILKMCAREGGRIITLHSRAAAAPLLKILSKEPSAGAFILHWFSGSVPQIKKAAEIGCWFSVGPAMLSSTSGLKAVSEMPPERILPETDGPFGKIDGVSLYPWEAWKIVTKLSNLWGKPTNEVENILFANFKKLTATFS